MKDFEVRQIQQDLFYNDLTHLVQESKKDGFRFLERLVNDYKAGINTFDKHGESLYGVFNKKNVLVGIGGLNIDPSSKRQEIGRLRRFYIAKDNRRNGLGKFLLNTIICDARKHYKVLVLYTDTEQADKFYISTGFLKGDIYLHTTHYLNL
ncbi:MULTISPECIES: GNAT family N-acetyltransferase [Bacillus]|uniref:GNAT family N-acetyltransferase n=1 Tax=Bacillus TaxID=1386 RepID=UPI0001A19435|nr:GNAT family N-acetyltransferase [Bacillus pseudomycoides]EEM13904.1 Acetyltransferase, GNAT [Bacillus pseudomycoides DSM 12442]MED1599070.1 GNAT family N-acetyltransferase [Bacillus pseudomycoides]MED4711929.1 GNAT family N-acetyltransferase [Bacillus pseudomycoides]OOR46567.1 N-acetyltransferase [Bacillus pseudomycoides]PDY08027.1 N-acetyltransferase [Bacillus pseudomycoides]